MSDAKAESADAPAAAPGPSKLPLLVALVNTVFVLAAVGMLVYTKLLYKRPQITEETERARLEALKAKPKAPVVPGQVAFEPVTINIAANPNEPKAADGTTRQIQGKLHYAQIGMVLEIADVARKDDVEELRQKIMDQLLSLVGRKQFHELSSVQGRYLLRGEIADMVNDLVAKGNAEAGRSSLVTQVYFTQFLVQ